jgi:hypothetical protein
VVTGDGVVGGGVIGGGHGGVLEMSLVEVSFVQEVSLVEGAVRTASFLWFRLKTLSGR